MKKMILGLFLLLSILESATITTNKTTYAYEEPIEVSFSEMSVNSQDWIGVFLAGSDTSVWENVKKWDYIGGNTNGTTTIDSQDLTAFYL